MVEAAVVLVVGVVVAAAIVRMALDGVEVPAALFAVTVTVCEPTEPLKVSLDVGPATPTDQRVPSSFH